MAATRTLPLAPRARSRQEASDYRAGHEDLPQPEQSDDTPALSAVGDPQRREAIDTGATSSDEHQRDRGF